MSRGVLDAPGIDTGAIEVLLCDADGNLFPSEGPAFEASAQVTNALLADLGVNRVFTAEELRKAAVGRNFRSTASELAARHRKDLGAAALERYVEEEKRAVTAHLGHALSPVPEVVEPVGELARRFRLAAVSSSAMSRLDACFGATGLAELFPPEMRFSAEDSLEAPASKPDPAIYAFACRALELPRERALAIEDAPAGVRSAVGAGIATVANLTFVPPGERAERRAALREAGAAATVDSWWELAEMLGVRRSSGVAL